MQRITQGIVAELASGVSDVLTQAGVVVTGGQGGYIRDGMPESVYGQIQLETARQACRNYADNPGGLPDRFKVRVENACRPYLNDIGYGAGGSVAVPFPGGQCPGTLYRVEGTYVASCNFDQVLPWRAFALGPLNGIGFFNGNPVNGWAVQGTASGGGPKSFNCNTLGGNGIGVIPRPGSTCAGRFPGGIGDAAAANPPTITSIVAISGPDNCGDPPPDVTDPVPPSVPTPPVVRFNPGPDIDVNIGVEFNVDGSINVDFGTGPVQIDPFGDPPPDGGGGGGGPPPGDVGEPGAGGNTGTGPEGLEGEAPEGFVIVGLLLSLVTIPPRAKEFAVGVWRGAAYVYMGTPTGLDQDFAGSMLRDGQFIYAEKDNLTRWRVQPNMGFNWNVTPYYREVEE